MSINQLKKRLNTKTRKEYREIDAAMLANKITSEQHKTLREITGVVYRMQIEKLYK